MNRLLRMFKPEVEVAIKLAVVVVLTGVWVLTFAWGYEGRQQARRWRAIACTYRVSDLERVTPGLAANGAACDTLDRIGLNRWGAPGAPHAPRRSERPGEAGTLLDQPIASRPLSASVRGPVDAR